MTLLIDADMLVYTACCSSEFDCKFNEYQHVLLSDECAALDYIAAKLEEYQSITGDRGKIIMCFSDYPTFRHEVYSEYKANRIGKRKPLAFKDVAEAVRRYHDAVSYTHLTLPTILRV